MIHLDRKEPRAVGSACLIYYLVPALPSIDDDKRDPRRAGWLKYRLRRATVYQSPAGHCFTDHLDDESAFDPEVDDAALTPALERYLAGELSWDRARVARQLELVRAHVTLPGARVLDVGCGAGVLLAELRALGADVEATELDAARVVYARRTHGLSVHRRTLEDAFMQEERAGAYDAIMLWDTLEHMNFPARSLRAAAALLGRGGRLFIETPDREGAFHRIGDASYRLSRGRFPTLLDLMYSNHAFGHKQILTRAEVRDLLERAGLEVELMRSIHELSLPCHYYLQKLTGSRRAARVLAPAARALFALAPLRNKIIAVARKR
jgi:2-polyprenyl-6-hydroxyphenyl methylase/3-demethylubiquinone-9 3-methyltransferase